MSSAPTGHTGKSDRSSRKSKRSGAPQPRVRIGQPLRDLIDAGKKSPFLWSIVPSLVDEQLVDDLEAWHSGSRLKKLDPQAIERLERWLASTIEASAAETLRSLQSLDFLPQLEKLRSQARDLGKKVSAETELRLIDLSQRIIERAENIAALAATSSIKEPYWQLLASVELPLAISAIVRRGKSSVGRFDGIREHAHRLLDEYCDTDGIPHAEHLVSLRAVVATLVRSDCWARSLKIKLLHHELHGIFQGLVEQAIRFSRIDRSQLGADRGEWSWSKRLFERAIDLCSDKELAAVAYPACRVGHKEPMAYVESLSSASTHSDWSHVSLLRSNWTAKASKLLVNHDQGKVKLELETIVPILSGEWTLSLDRDGKTLQSTDEWSVVCWHEDDSVAYLELEKHFEQGVRVQRQMLLGREDDILFMADAILGDEEAAWDYRATVPLAAEISGQSELETYELRLRTQDKHDETVTAAAVVPLFLPEWKLPPIDAGLEIADGKVVAFQRLWGKRLYFPLFLDIRSWRATSPLTWRRLTVAEQLQICDPSVAVAFRVQVGWEQWAFYRSLAPAGNRTFFGENLISDFFAGQFDPDSGMNELLRIEASIEE